MRLYVLRIGRSEDDADGVNRDEWFATLRDARHRRENLIAEAVAANYDGMIYRSDFEIDSYELASLPRVEMVIALLNRRGCFKGKPVCAVPEWVRPGTSEGRDEGSKREGAT